MFGEADHHRSCHERNNYDPRQIRDPDNDNDNDDVLEGGESLTVTLTDITTTAGAVQLGTPNEATTTIIDQGTVTVRVDDSTADRGR